MSLPLPLSPNDQKRIERLKNRKGRVKPARVPARLARTSAFAPKRRGLSTDSNFKRIYVVPNYSIVKVTGRELGTQHRDALYAIFRLPHKRIVISDDESPIGRTTLNTVKTTWRDLLLALRLTPHANNVANLFITLEEIKQVGMTIYEGDQQILIEKLRRNELPDAKGAMKSLLHDIEFTGLKLDDDVVITYGKWATESMERLRLVSLNADVQFKLKSDYAKCFWPHIDSFTKHTWVDEDMLAALVSRDLWNNEAETAVTRRNFRLSCRNAFADMQRAGGLKEWSCEVRGSGRKKTRRYHYKTSMPIQMELTLNEPE